MSEAVGVDPLTETERAQLATLQYRQSMEEWQEGENKRQADLAALEPVIAALGNSEELEQLISSLEEGAAGLDRSGRQSVDRIISILGYDGRALAARYESLSQPAPQPFGDPAEEPT